LNLGLNLPTFTLDLINIFKYETIVGYVLLILLALGLNVWWLFTGDVPTISLSEGTHVFNGIQEAWQPLNSIIQYLVFVLLICLQSFLINNISNRFELVGRPSLLVGFFYLMFLIWCFSSPLLSPAFLALFPIILGVDKVYALLLADRPVDVFDIGFLTTLSALVYPPFSLFMLFVLFLFMRTRSVEWRHWILLIIGTALPFFFLWLYWWLFSKTPSNEFFNSFVPIFSLPNLDLFKDPRWIFKMVTLLVFGIGIGFWSQRVIDMELRKKRLLRWLIGLFVFKAVLLFGISSYDPNFWMYTWAIPLALLVGIVSFYTNKGNLLSLLSIIFIGLILVFQYF